MPISHLFSSTVMFCRWSHTPDLSISLPQSVHLRWRFSWIPRHHQQPGQQLWTLNGLPWSSCTFHRGRPAATSWLPPQQRLQERVLRFQHTLPPIPGVSLRPRNYQTWGMPEWAVQIPTWTQSLALTPEALQNSSPFRHWAEIRWNRGLTQLFQSLLFSNFSRA